VEYFNPRGMAPGGPACFCCGAHQVPNLPSAARQLSAFVGDDAASKKVEAIFREAQAPCLRDYRSSYPLSTMMHIGACEEHIANLRYLRELTVEAQQIDLDILKAAMLPDPTVAVG
jgi:hypothetical protein